MTNHFSISPKQARKLVVISQNIHHQNASGSSKQATLKIIKKLGYVQIDTISVVERAHHHILWTRNPRYTPSQLEQLVEERQVFEYWSHAAAYLPISYFRYSLPKKQAIAAGEKHWRQVDEKVKARVLKRITEEGPLQARDFSEQASIQHAWGDFKPAKIALEQLFMEGKLMIAKRQGFQKVYDLTERVLPDWVDTSMPNEDEWATHLIDNYLQANGLGSTAQIAYLRKGKQRLIARRCRQMWEEGLLVNLKVGQYNYFAQPDFDQQLKQRVSRTGVKILNPFDNLLIQRQRTSDLFGFDYVLECYVPATKRHWGYFVLPLLRGTEFVGRIDAKLDRKTGLMSVHKLYTEASTETKKIAQQIEKPLQNFAGFCGGTHFEIIELAN